jgi:5-(carboxyamino)imidazole ribonucleotide synthase
VGVQAGVRSDEKFASITSRDAALVAGDTVSAVATPVLGIVGEGHLARRLAVAASRLAVESRVVSTLDELRANDAPRVDVVTITHDDADPGVMLDWERSGIMMRPGPSTMAIVADRVAMRRLVSATGVPVPPWRQVTDEDELRAALTTWPSAVLKSPRAGRYRSGVEMPGTALDGLRSGLASLRNGEQLLVEPFLELDLEISVAVARRPGGEHVVYEPVRTVQLFGRCREVVSPSGIDDAMKVRATEVATTLAERLQVVGLLVVEMFVVGDELMVNEVIARPHHTAPHAEVANATSQVENHVRALLDLPLGATDLTDDTVVMVNVVGNAAGNDPRHHLAEGLASDPSNRIELLGDPHRFDRVLGHVVTRGQDALDVRRRAWQAVIALRGDLTPIRPIVGGGDGRRESQERGNSTTAPATRRLS